MRTISATSFVAAAAVAAAGFAGSAQAQLDPSLITGLSSGCAGSLVSLVTNSSGVSQCLSLPTAVGALTSAGNNSVIPGLQSYLSGSICGSGKPVCSQSQLQSANQTLLQGCSSDLQSNNGQNIPALIAFFLNRYSQLREGACLQAASNSSYCLITALYSVQNTTGQQLSFSGLQSLLGSQQGQQQALQALASNRTAFCTDCNKGLYSALFNGTSNQQVSGAVSQTCGSSFVDGQIPSTLKSTASGSSSSSAPSGSGSGSSGSSGNGASGINAGAVAAFGSALAAVAAGLALL
ncbi:hypothetical protein PSEUBRA_004982 [Kalmanozyma brasiliensis GHG001]|uniref:Uncharacterized protein n=1 Tax=Kalmanozyma brasiliensis (strain GHG001) TaxID=1365824 RepID=V5ESJ4_KALBG|nr:uncharacterized protein PSEUBRA_004982 [Kalmanozyma brasiliensis GHG001]EST05933.1 hypothetical protein PSEUBRA_004982 [Kalmanozyma brasiliensis GHG001]